MKLPDERIRAAQEQRRQMSWSSALITKALFAVAGFIPSVRARSEELSVEL